MQQNINNQTQFYPIWLVCAEQPDTKRLYTCMLGYVTLYKLRCKLRLIQSDLMIFNEMC
jgi:hypothetical protein